MPKPSTTVAKAPQPTTVVPPPTAATVTLGTIVLLREMHNPLDESTLHFVPAIVLDSIADGRIAAMGFPLSGARPFMAVSMHSIDDSLASWCTREEYAAKFPADANRRFPTKGLPPEYGTPVAGINVGSVVCYRAPSEGGGWATATAVSSVDCPAIVQAILPDGLLSLVVFSPRGVSVVHDCSYSRNHPGCWWPIVGGGSIGTLVAYRSGRPEGKGGNPYLEPDADTAERFVHPAIALNMTPDGQLQLMVFRDEGPVVVDNCHQSPDEIGCYFPL